MTIYQGFYNGVPLRLGSGGNNQDQSKSDRPEDWLHMPVPEDDEIYMLFLIDDGELESPIAFTVTCTGSYTVELGTVENDVFVSNGEKVTKYSDSTYQALLVGNDFKDLTSYGYKQVMIKISGKYITKWKPVGHDVRPNYGIYRIVDIRCRLPKGQNMIVSTNIDANHTLYQLRYFSWEGSNELTNANNMFLNCYDLVEISELDFSKVTTAKSCFRLCYSLSRMPELDCSSLINAEEMFFNCYTIKHIPDLDTRKVTNMSKMFNYAVCLQTAPQLDYSSALDLTRIFYGCITLGKVLNMNLTKATNMSESFSNMNSFSRITFDPDVEGWSGVDIALNVKKLSHAAIVEMIESLPTITESHTISLKNNFGVEDLTSDEIAMARAKNWILQTS